MPYSGADDPNIPGHVPPGKRGQWAAVWNKTYMDCQNRGGRNCEGVAFRMANGTIKEDKAGMKTNILIEQAELVEDTLNHDRREVEVVLIRPGRSANGRYYAPGVLARAAQLFENSRAFANHPTPEQIKKGEGRDVTGLTGRFYNVHIGEAGELRATRKVYDNPAGNAVWPAIVDAIETKAPVIGLSINAVGKAAPGKDPDGLDGIIVEDITAVASVDDVIAPAAGGSFERLVASGDDLLAAVLESMSYEEFITARPDFIDSLKKQMKRERQDDAVRAVSDERDQVQGALTEAQTEIEHLREQLDAHRTDLEQARLDKLRAELAVTLEQALREARLLPEWETELRTQLEHTPPGEWADVIARERRKAKAAGAKPAVAVEGVPRLMEGVTIGAGKPDLEPRPGETFDQWNKRISTLPGRG